MALPSRGDATIAAPSRWNYGVRECLLLLLMLAGCARAPAPQPPAQPRYEVGQPYQLGGFWSYPREDFALVEAGLGVVLPAGTRRTRQSEIFEDSAMLAAHRSLQLPAIINVTNLENGRSVTLRVIERGPAAPGRIVGVSRRAGELLGVAPGASFQARLEVQGEASRALAGGLPSDRPALAIAAAPVGRVERESLDAPAGARAQAARPTQTRATAVALAEPTAADMPALRLPATMQQGIASPGRLYLDAGTYFTQSLALRQAGRVGGRAEPIGARNSRQQEYRVRAGPFATVAEADAALGRARAAGFPELRIVVE